MTDTLVVFDRTIESTSPGENFWQGYDHRLRRKLSALGAMATPEQRAPFWKRIFAVSLPVPVPVAAVVVIALLVTSILALRPSGAEATATPAAVATVSAAPAPVQIVEVPVVSERVVTRIVYVERKGREKNEARREQTLVAQSKHPASATHSEEEQSGFITRANLAGFEPTSEVKIRMIRRSDEVEK